MQGKSPPTNEYQSDYPEYIYLQKNLVRTGMTP